MTKKIIKTDFGKFTFLDERTVLGEAFSGVNIDKNIVHQTIEMVEKELSGDFAFIFRRSTDYSIMPVEVYSQFSQVERLKAIAIVRQEGRDSLPQNMEQNIYKGNIKKFNTVEEACDWIKRIFENGAAKPPSGLINQIKVDPASVEFEDVIATIDANYQYTPTRFTNGKGDNAVINEAGSNEGSCKIFAFAQLNGLNREDTLACFGHYYRDDVLKNPDGGDHANIRNFMRHGWDGIRFDGNALSAL